MKKNVMMFILIVIAMGFTNLSAQNPFHFGVKAGLNMNNVKSSTDLLKVDEQSNTLTFGAIVSYSLIDKLMIVSGIDYIPVNSKISFGYSSSSSSSSNNYGIITRDYKTSYLGIPVMVKATLLPVNDKISIWGMAGVEYGFLLSAKADESFVSTKSPNLNYTKSDIDVKDDFESSFMKTNIAVGVDYAMSDKLKLFMELNYSFGLNDVYKKEYKLDNTIISHDGKINQFGVSVGIMF